MRAASSWSRQSQRSEPMASPVRHSECRRTGTSSAFVDVPVHERGVLLAVAVVPERDDLELTEPGGQIGDGGDADADLVPAHPFAVVTAVLVQKLFDLQVRQCHGGSPRAFSEDTPLAARGKARLQTTLQKARGAAFI